MSTELNHDDVALTATFMVTGMIEYDIRNSSKGPGGKNTKDIYLLWDQGALELHMEMIGYAKVAMQACAIITSDEDYGFPGVFDYEVSESFGAWYAQQLYEHGGPPSRGSAMRYLLKEIAGFFSQAYDADQRQFQMGVAYGQIKGLKYV